jgi:serine phosphatase RsbU (regulator of sigma subunit)
MSSRRRTLGVLAALGLLAALAAYETWRLHAIGRVGWAGMSYFPDVNMNRKGKAATKAASFTSLKPGSIIFVYPGGPAEQAGLARQNLVASINGIPLHEGTKIDALARRVRYGDVLTYRTTDNKRTQEHRVRFGSPMEVPVFLVIFIAMQFAALAFLTIGTFVFWRLPEDPRALIFFLMTLFATIWMSGTALAQVEAQNSRGIVMTTPSTATILQPIAFVLIGMFFAPLLLHLALTFPKPRPVIAKYGRTLFHWIYGFPIYTCVMVAAFIALSSIPAQLRESDVSLVMKAIIWPVLAALAAATAVSLWRIGTGVRRSGLKQGIVRQPFGVMTIVLGACLVVIGFAARNVDKTHSVVPIMIAIIICIFLGFAALAGYPVSTFIALLRSYRESNAEERRQVKWPLWGTMVSVGAKIVMTVAGIAIGLLSTFGTRWNVPSLLMTIPDAVSRLLYILIPIAFAFAILKYRLMNIDVIIRRTVLYSILSAVVFVLYGVLVAGVGTMLVRFAGVKNQTMVIASTIVVALVAVPLRNRLQGLVDRNLFREKRDYPQALREIADSIGRVDVEGLLRQSAELIQQAMQTQFILIALRSEKQFVASAKVGLADEVIERFRLPAGAIDLSRTLDARRDELPPELRRLGAAMVVPVSIHREALGFIAAGGKLSHEEIGRADDDFLASAAAQIALGIENSRLRTEEAEFAQARAIQQVLLPTHFPQLEGFRISGKWQPARSVGGDYFDTLALGGSKAAVCIADVAGKGMPAALLMANLQAAVKATAGPDVSPSLLIGKVKRVVVDNLGGKFISFFYGILDAASRTFTYSNAGHNPPFVVRADGSVERLTAGGPVFGRLFLNDPHQEGTVTLRPGDRVVLFTDGASEARRGDDEFGEERLASVIAANRHLGAAALQEKIADELSAYSGGNLADDVTLVVISAEG